MYQSPLCVPTTTFTTPLQQPADNSAFTCIDAGTVGIVALNAGGDVFNDVGKAAPNGMLTINIGRADGHMDGGILYPSAFELVTEIAKRDKAVIIPTGATAANRLGFSTQVPMNTSFLTTGSGRKLSLGNRTVTLKHGAPRNYAFEES